MNCRLRLPIAMNLASDLSLLTLCAALPAAAAGDRVRLITLDPGHFHASLVDGLVRRDVRGFGAGRESGFVYHRARASLMPLAVLPWVTYLALPVSVHPLLILLPSAALLGVAVCIAAATFKKYL